MNFANSELLRGLGRRLKSIKPSRPMAFMEVCGTHTMTVHRSGLRALLPDGLRLISGPGCPVCVTPAEYIDTALAMAHEHGVIIVTFGDMMRVPGGSGSLSLLRAEGGDVEVVYSPLGALELARRNPDQEVVFAGVGFETTAPTVAATIRKAFDEAVKNFSVLCAHKLIPPALLALLNDPDSKVDGFMLPGHVSIMLGVEPYRFAAEKYGSACVIAGFEPADVMQALVMLEKQVSSGKPKVEVQYSRGIKPEGNRRALGVMNDVFEPVDTHWRGFGVIPASGLRLREEYAAFDAELRFPVKVAPVPEPKGCICGEVVSGKVEPTGCALFGRRCTPESPVGPCMVSSEGTCAAFYKYSFKSPVETGKATGDE